MIGVGDKFPEFELNGVSGHMGNIDPDWKDADHDFIKVSSWDLSDWSVIYFYPKDFTFICPTEIVGMDSLLQETNEVFGISPDNEYCKWNWKTGDEHAELYGVAHALLADCNNALNTGRNANEVLRTLQALKAGGLTGCEWNPGDEFVV